MYVIIYNDTLSRPPASATRRGRPLRSGIIIIIIIISSIISSSSSSY